MPKVQILDIEISRREVEVPDACPDCLADLTPSHAVDLVGLFDDIGDYLSNRAGAHLGCNNCGRVLYSGKLAIHNQCPWATPDRRCKLREHHEGPHELPLYCGPWQPALDKGDGE